MSYTILICPECGKQCDFSAMDAIHGFGPRCYSHGLEEMEDEHGRYTRVKPGPALVVIEVLPKAKGRVRPALQRWLGGK